MPPAPWWIDRVDEVLTVTATDADEPGPLWHLSERLQFIRENVDPSLLLADFEALPSARERWGAFAQREREVMHALEVSVARLASALRTGAFTPQRFRSTWEGLGYLQHAEGGGTPADDYLDAVAQVSRLTLGEARPAQGMLNVASRAARIADFLALTEPGPDDLVIDLGSGSGKLALTVAASAPAQVQGVECGGSYVSAATRSAAFLGLANLRFVHADVREVDLSKGTIFYLYYPFHGEVARSVAKTLARLAAQKQVTVYLQGPRHDFGEHFLKEVDDGSFSLCARTGEFSEVMVLRSARAPVPCPAP